MKRTVTPELLDTDSGTPGEAATALADLRRINGWFGASVRAQLDMSGNLERTTHQGVMLRVSAGHFVAFPTTSLVVAGVESLAIGFSNRFNKLSSACNKLALASGRFVVKPQVSSPRPVGRGRCSLVFTIDQPSSMRSCIMQERTTGDYRELGKRRRKRYSKNPMAESWKRP